MSALRRRAPRPSAAPPLEIVMRSLAALMPYANNPRTHSDGQVSQIAASIREFGFTNPVLVDGDGGIIAGHGRVLAAAQLGLDQVPTIALGYLTLVQRRAYVIADNQLALNAGWNLELLRLELQALDTDHFDLSLTGFGEDQLADLLNRSTGLTDPDEAPPLPEQPVTQLGDLWTVGRHRLLCGDATVTTEVERVLGGVKPHLMVTDPPYGVAYDPGWRNEAKRAGAMNRVIGATAVGKIENDGRADWREAWELFPGAIAYVWHGGLHAHTVADSLIACGFLLRSQIVWAKPRHVISRGHYHWQHESCWYGVRKGETGHWHGDRSQTTIWAVTHMASETGHSAQKPVECMRRPIENNSSPGQAVYDPFVGSGTTLIAAEMTGRACHALEISPAYCDVTVQRWQNFTGEQATLDGDGRSFEEIEAIRKPAAVATRATTAADSPSPP